MANTDLGDKLFQALRKSGYKFLGKMDLKSVNPEEYVRLSSQEMAKKYATDNNLDPKEAILSVLQAIYELNQTGKGKFPMKRSLDDKRLNYRLYMAAIFESGLIVKHGQAAGTAYTWKPVTKPVYKDADNIYELTKDIDKRRLTIADEKYIEQNYGLGVDELNRISNPKELPAKAYLINRMYIAISQREMKKNRRAKPSGFSRELSRTSVKETMEKFNELTQVNTIPEAGKEPLKESTKKPVNVDMILFLLQQQNDLYKALIDSKDNYIKILEQKLLDK